MDKPNFVTLNNRIVNTDYLRWIQLPENQQPCYKVCSKVNGCGQEPWETMEVCPHMKGWDFLERLRKQTANTK